MGWGLLVSATGVWNRHGFDNWVLDNGAWTAFNKGSEFDSEKFRGVLAWSRGEEVPPRFIVVPDIVSDDRSLEFSRSWFPEVQEYTDLPLIAVQDGMSGGDVEGLVSSGAGIFLGGSTEYKLGHLEYWGDFCREKGAYYHVGRVNSQKRIRLCFSAGADSFDGTSVTKFPSSLTVLDRALAQLPMRF